MSAKGATGNGNLAKTNRQKSVQNAKARTGKPNAPNTTKDKGPQNEKLKITGFEIYKSQPQKFGMFTERLYGYTLGELEDIAGIIGAFDAEIDAVRGEELADRIMAIVKRFKKQ